MKEILKGKNRGTTAFYGLIGLAAMILFAQPFSPAIKKIRLKQFHLQQKSFGLFALVHFIPPMYSYANEVWYTNRLVDFSEIEPQTESKGDTIHYWLNHYPLRFVTFSTFGRKIFFDAQGPHYIYVRSKYGDTTLRTVYALQRDASGLAFKMISTGETP